MEATTSHTSPAINTNQLVDFKAILEAAKYADALISQHKNG